MGRRKNEIPADRQCHLPGGSSDDDRIFKDREYTDEERIFLMAVDRWRRLHQKKFLDAVDYLHIAIDLGYRQ